MNPAPGGIPWLLAHELRLAWYGAAVHARGRRRPGVLAIMLWAAGWIALHAVAWGLLKELGPHALASPLMAMAASGVLYAAATFMLSTALRASVLALFERGDLDLLLSSPLPSRTIFAVRLLGVTGTAGALFLYLFTPLANAGLASGQPGWLGIYPALLAMAVLASCVAMLATLALVRVLGARRTRTVAQVLAGVAGALLFLLSQSANLAGHGAHGGAVAERVRQALAHGVFRPDSLLWLPGRAALGDASGLLALAGLAVVALIMTVARTHRFFVHGLQQAAGSMRTAPVPAGPLRLHVRRSLFDTVVMKEWRLVARDPHLLSQVLLQSVYLLPLLVLIVRGNASPGPALAAGLALLSSSLTGGLAWIVIAGEEAPDLLRSSPAAWRTVRLAKLAASTMPVLLLVALPLLWLVVRAPLPGLLACFTTTGAVLGAGLVVLWAGRPAPRSDFRARGKENLLSTMFGLLNSICWGGLAWLLPALLLDASPAYLLGAAAALAGAVLTLALAWTARQPAL